MRKFPVFTIFAIALSACSGSQGSSIEYVSETILEAGQEIVDIHVEKSPVAYSPESGIRRYSEHPWQWIKVTHEESGPVSFRVEWGRSQSTFYDIVVEEFASPFDGEPPVSAAASHVRNHLSDDGERWLTTFSKNMVAGESAYFRVRGDGFGQTGPYTFTCLPGEAAAPDGYSTFDGPLYAEPNVISIPITNPNFSVSYFFKPRAGWFPPEYVWFRIDFNSAGLYHLFVDYEKNESRGPTIVVEEFPSPFGGYGTDSRIALHETNYLWTYDGDLHQWLIYFTQQVDAGESLYFRVRELDYDQPMSFEVCVSSVEPQYNLPGTITPLPNTDNSR